MPNIFTINKDIFDLMQKFDNIEPTEADPTGELQQAELLKQLMSLEQGLGMKFEGIAKYRNELLGDVQTIDAEIQRLQALKKSKESRAEAYFNIIAVIMKAQGIQEQETATFKFQFNKNPAKIVVQDTALLLLPDNLKSYSIVREPTPENIEKIKSIGIDISESVGNKNEIKKRYDALPAAEKEAIKDMVYLEQSDRLVIK